jgi:hypothetical protein
MANRNMQINDEEMLKKAAGGCGNPLSDKHFINKRKAKILGIDPGMHSEKELKNKFGENWEETCFEKEQQSTTE